MRVLLSLLFFSLFGYISTTVAPIAMKVCMMILIGPGQIFSRYAGGTPGTPQIRNFVSKFWPFDREYIENDKSQRYISLRA